MNTKQYNFSEDQRKIAQEHFDAMTRADKISAAARLLRMFPPKDLPEILVGINEQVANAINLPAQNIYNAASIKRQRRE